ncbi:bifunctional oligoribonuclease/PAP phosphatase NrnA [Patescibacteria group bacterium]
MEAEFKRAKRLMDGAERIVTIAHRKPDGDTLGSCIALKHALTKMGKEVTMACIDEIPERYSFMPDVKDFIHEFDFREFDLLIVCDAGASYMTNYHEQYPDIFKGEVPVINIDHHASNDNFGTINIVDTNAASTTMIMYNFFKFAKFDFNPLIGTALLTGLYNDTGSFMHQNTTPEALKIAGEMMEAGGRVADVSRNLFKTTPVSTLKLWGKVLANLKVNSEKVAMSVVTKDDFDQCDAEIDELSGAVDFINCVPNTKFTVLLHEDEQGNVKGSFRTRNEEVDLEEIASKFGGGGHKKAAGFTLPGKLEKEVRWKIVPSIEDRKHRAIKGDISEIK